MRNIRRCIAALLAAMLGTLGLVVATTGVAHATTNCQNVGECDTTDDWVSPFTDGAQVVMRWNGMNQDTYEFLNVNGGTGQIGFVEAGFADNSTQGQQVHFYWRYENTSGTENQIDTSVIINPDADYYVQITQVSDDSSTWNIKLYNSSLQLLYSTSAANEFTDASDLQTGAFSIYNGSPEYCGEQSAMQFLSTNRVWVANWTTTLHPGNINGLGTVPSGFGHVQWFVTYQSMQDYMTDSSNCSL